MEKSNHYPLSYRSNETRQLMGWIRAGQCGCLVGLRGSGKSTLLEFVAAREDLHRLHLGSEPFPIFILLDLLSLIEVSEWAANELILSRLVRQLQWCGIEADRVEEMAALHQEFIRDRQSPLAHRAIEQCLDLLYRQAGPRVVMIFDEFDHVFGTLGASLFRFLRSLHNTYRGQLSYIVAVSRELAELRESVFDVDHFYRMLSRNVCRLGPLSEADACEMIGFQAARQDMVVSEPDAMRLVELTGGHSSLLKACLSLLLGTDCQGDLTKFKAMVGNTPSIEYECRKIWESLSMDEQACLWALVHTGPISPQPLRRLIDRGVLLSGPEPTIFSPLFTAFVRTQAPPPQPDSFIDRTERFVQLDGRRIEGLSELEFEVLCYLYERRGYVCTRDDLIKNVYRRRFMDLQGGVSNDSIDKMLSRLRKKIEPDPSRPVYVRTVRGEGYKFVGREPG